MWKPCSDYVPDPREAPLPEPWAPEQQKQPFVDMEQHTALLLASIAVHRRRLRELTAISETLPNKPLGLVVYDFFELNDRSKASSYAQGTKEKPHIH